MHLKGCARQVLRHHKAGMLFDRPIHLKTSTGSAAQPVVCT